MKKFVTLLCGVMAAILLSACQNNAEPPKAAEPVKALVVYYSLTGHTEAMAQTIAADVKGDLFRLEVVNAYPKQQKQREKRIKKEFTGKLPALKALPKVADYDVIFIGYPVWYSKLPPALTSFLKKSKLADKKVAFFCTSGSSPISVTLDELKNLIPQSASWIGAKRLTSAAEASEWIDTLKLKQ